MNLSSLTAAPEGKNKKVLLCPCKCFLKLSMGSRVDKRCPSYSFHARMDTQVMVLQLESMHYYVDTVLNQGFKKRAG